jgi:hypothetical protein
MKSRTSPVDGDRVMLYNETMGRPRKFENRMTRTLTLRVPDDLYDWLIDQAVDGHDGDLSEATRSALLKSQILDRILSSRDPKVELEQVLAESLEQEGLEAYFDEFGHYPGEAPSEN